MNMLHDINDKPSAKRITAICGAVAMTAISVIAVIKDPSQAATILWPWAIMVGALLGVTVLERGK